MFAQQLPMVIFLLITSILTARFCRNILTATDINSWQYEARITIINLYDPFVRSMHGFFVSKTLCFIISTVILAFTLKFGWYLIAGALALQFAIIFHFIRVFQKLGESNNKNYR